VPIARVAAVVLACLSLSAPLVAQPATADVEAAVAAATSAVREAFGGDADVALSSPVLTLVPGAGAIVRAVPEPSSRTGGPVRFVLYGEGGGTPARVGRLGAVVQVVAPHVRTRQKIAIGDALTADALEVVRDDVGRQPLAPLPGLEAVRGLTTRKALLAGEIVTRVAAVVPALVNSGDEVVTIARVGALEVRGRAVAAQSGTLGATVIVVNPDSKKRLRARVVGEALVEVLHAS
jgi:flagella basal body P-ring formation protein FlgA